MADEAKAKGNAAFTSGDFNAAIKHFTEAINLAPTNHSNRPAAYASLHQYDAALSDAKKTVELKPDWSKGYSRLGAAHLASRSRAAPPPSLFGDAFQGPEMWAKLTADPTTWLYLQQPDFVKAMQDIQKNPNKLNGHLKDQGVMQALGVLLNVKFKAHGAGDDMDIPEADSPPTPQPSQPAKEKVRNPDPETEPGPMEISEEEKEKKEKEKALKEKAVGNAANKKKDFETAIQHYTTAMELDDGDISYITNRAAVYLEMEKYPEAVKHYTESLRRNPKDPRVRSLIPNLHTAIELHAYTKLGEMPEGLKDAEKCIELDPTFSKGYTRKGAIQFFMKEYDKALETYQEGLTHDPNNQELLNGVQRCVEQIDKASYNKGRKHGRCIEPLDIIAERMVAREIKEGDSVMVDVDTDGNVVVLNG
ncbi:hypothetical protein V6N13_145828 [Hibiscus sabdariffa]